MSREAANVLTRAKHFAWSLRRLAEDVKDIRQSFTATGVNTEVAGLPQATDFVQGDGLATDTTKQEFLDAMEALRKFDEDFIATNGPVLRNILHGL
jgi:hypothetical protein